MINSLIKGKGGAGGGREGGERSTRYSGNFGARGGRAGQSVFFELERWFIYLVELVLFSNWTKMG